MTHRKAHLLDLASQLGVDLRFIYGWDPSIGDDDDSPAAFRESKDYWSVQVPDPETEHPLAYLVALHELGHAATDSRIQLYDGLMEYITGDPSPSRIKSELRAWEWALAQYSGKLTFDEEARIAFALRSYGALPVEIGQVLAHAVA